MDWKLLLTVTAPVVASLLTLILSNLHSASIADREREFRSREEERKRIFAAQESRYVDRRDAVISFEEAVRNEEYRIVRFHENPEYAGVAPGDLYEDYDFGDLNVSFAAVALLADEAVINAAENLQAALVDCFFGKSKSFNELRVAQRNYRRACRFMLSPKQSIEGPRG